MSIIYFSEKGLEVDACDRSNRTAMHHASMFGCEVAACYLISMGAYVNPRDNEGETPLHWAVKNYLNYPNMDCIKKLLLNGAEREAFNKDGFRPIDYLERIMQQNPDISEDY